VKVKPADNQANLFGNKDGSKEGTGQNEEPSTAPPQVRVEQDLPVDQILETPVEDLPMPTRQIWGMMILRQGQIRSPLVQHGRADGPRKKAKPA
jgi:hypothetical protein